jgi:hypothetical protein
LCGKGQKTAAGALKTKEKVLQRRVGKSGKVISGFAHENLCTYGVENIHGKLWKRGNMDELRLRRMN